MDNFLKSLFDFFADRTNPFPRKIFAILFIIILVVLINDVFGFSFYYNTSHKINQLKIIYELYPKNKIDENQLFATLNDLELQIIKRESSLLIKRLFSGSILLILVTIMYPFVEKDKKDEKELSNAYLGTLFILIVFNSLLLLIPTFDNLLKNHAINIFSSIVLLIILGSIGTRNEKREAREKQK